MTEATEHTRTYIHTHVYINTHICIHTCSCAHIRVCMCVYTPTHNTYMYIYSHLHLHIYMCVCVCVCIYIYIYFSSFVWIIFVFLCNGKNMNSKACYNPGRAYFYSKHCLLFLACFKTGVHKRELWMPTRHFFWQAFSKRSSSLQNS